MNRRRKTIRKYCDRSSRSTESCFRVNSAFLISSMQDIDSGEEGSAFKWIRGVIRAWKKAYLCSGDILAKCTNRKK